MTWVALLAAFRASQVRGVRGGDDDDDDDDDEGCARTRHAVTR
ncbi:hypothetical protein [Dietzia massiliensis]|nr:hypothetical protein [Dietzia massiliensis]